MKETQEPMTELPVVSGISPEQLNYPPYSAIDDSGRRQLRISRNVLEWAGFAWTTDKINHQKFQETWGLQDV